MRIAVVLGLRSIEVRVKMLVETMLPGDGVQVRSVIRHRRIVVVLAGRVARRRAGVRISEADIVGSSDILRQKEPPAVSRPLVLELKIGRQESLQVLVDRADGQSEIEGVLQTGL